MRMPRRRAAANLSFFLAVLLGPCLSVASNPAATSGPVAGKDRSVTGTITDLAGRPVPGAEVELTRIPGGFPSCPFSQSEEIYHARTGPTGRFEVRGLPASWFELRIDHPDFAPLTRKGIATTDAAGPVELGKLALDTGRKLDGIVVDGEGRPLANTAIWVRGSEPFQAEGYAFIRRGPRKVTGADGKFSIPHLEKKGNFTLYACRRDRSRFVQALDEPLPRPFRIVLPSSGRVSGRIVDAEGRPIPGAQISAGIVGRVPSDVIDPYDPCPQTDQSAFARTDAEGRFILEPIAQGIFGVWASADGFLPYAGNEVELGGARDLRNLDIVLQQGASLAGQVRTRTGAPAPGVEISVSCREGGSRSSTGPDGRYRLGGLPPGGTCRISAAGGRFYREGETVEIKAAENHLDLQVEFSETQQVRGRVIGPEGEPVAGAKIDIPGTLDGAKPLTASDGSFLVEKFGKSSECEISVWKEGYAAFRSKNVKCGEAPANEMVIRLERALTLTGRLLNLDPEELRTVQISANNPTFFTPRGGVSPDGTYRIGDLGPGKWTVLAVAGRRAVKGQVTLRAGERNAILDLSFPDRFPVRGRVSGSEGEGVKGMSVSFGRSDYFREDARTQEDGSFEILLENGSYEVSIYGPDESGEGSRYILLSQPVTVVDAPLEGIEVHLKKGLTLHGCIPGLLPSEHPVVVASYQNTTRTYPIKADGCYRFKDLEPGDWSVATQLQTGDLLSQLRGKRRQIQSHITLAPGDLEAVLDLDLALGDRTLTVRPAGAEKQGELSLRLLFADGATLINSLSPEQDGAFQVDRLREGNYRIQIATWPDKVLVDQPVEVTSDREVTINLQPGPGR